MNEIKDKIIAKEEIDQLPVIQFSGKLHLIEQEQDADNAAEYLMRHKVLGFDTETRPAFKKSQNYKVALLQLATKDECFLFRLNKTGLTEKLVRLLKDDSVIKAGAAVRDDILALKKLNHFEEDGFVEIQKMASEMGIQRFSLRNLAAILLGQKLSKRQRLSNWEDKSLTEAQMNYAATDAWVSLVIYEKLLELRN